MDMDLNTDGFQTSPRPFALFVLITMLCVGGCRPRSPGVNPELSSVEAPTVGEERSGSERLPTIRFEDVTSTSNIDWQYQNGHEANVFSIVESMGGGTALCDFDQDGRLDVIAAGGGKFPAPQEIRGLPLGLWRQQPLADFENVAALAGVDTAAFFSHGVAAGDYDHDGFPDLAITGYGGVTVFHNSGDGTFDNLSHGCPEFTGGWSTSAGWADVNHDRVPDLLVVHYADWSFENHPECPGPPPHHHDVCPPRKFQGLPDQLFLGDGEGGFHEAGMASGIMSVRKGIGMAIADLDLDGDLDLYITNDTDPNDYYRNKGAGHFEEMGLEAGIALGADGNSDGSMGVDIGDYDGDGWLDVWVTNFEREVFALYRNIGGNQFQHVSRQVGINRLSGSYVGWGTAMLDADGDGDQDIFVTNGHVIRFPEFSSVKQPPLILENRGGKEFHNVAESAGSYFSVAHAGRSVSVGDIDHDGDPDLAVLGVHEPLTLLSNVAEWRGLAVRLIGRQSPRQPIGATVRCFAHGRVNTQQLTRGSGYASTSAETLFFGFGDGAADRLEITWPSGKRQVIDPVPVQTHLTVIEPQ